MSTHITSPGAAEQHMRARVAPSRSEMEIMSMVWSLQKATVKQVYSALPDCRTISFKTVQTFLRRLEDKGYLQSTIEARSRVYTALVNPCTVVQEAVHDFVTQLFRGRPEDLLEYLVRGSALSKQDIAFVCKRLLSAYGQGEPYEART